MALPLVRPRADGRLEQVGAFEEERPLLREEQREPLVGRDLGLVRLQLREVGVRRNVDRHARRHGQSSRRAQAEIDRIGRVRAGRHGNPLEEPCYTKPFQAGDAAALGQEAGSQLLGTRAVDANPVAPQRHPRVLFIEMLDLPQDVQAPSPARSSLVSQRLERDGDLDGVAARPEAAGRLHHQVDREVRLAAVHHDPVLLDAQGVHHHDVGAPPVVERIEVEADRVVVADGVPPGQRRPDATGLVVRQDRDVERLGGVGEPDLRRVRRLSIVAGMDLAEAGERRRLRPGLVLERAVDDGWVGDGRHHHRGRLSSARQSGRQEHDADRQA